MASCTSRSLNGGNGFAGRFGRSVVTVAAGGSGEFARVGFGGSCFVGAAVFWGGATFCDGFCADEEKSL